MSGTVKLLVAYYISLLVVALLILWGWGVNIVKIVQADAFGTLAIVRVIGAFIVPLGGFLGWFV